jgi:Autotransporter beta-domain
MKCVPTLCALLALTARSAQAQTMLDQEQRLLEIHSLLVALPPNDAPGAYRAGEISLGIEVIGIPTINGQTGGKFQFTASDRTFAFPRPRLALGLPAPDRFRAFVGLSYIPPITVFEINEHFAALEAGLAWVADNPFAVGIRASALVSRAKTSVTDPGTRDTLENFEFGGDLSAGYRLELGAASVTPFAGVGVTRVNGNFRITSDDVLLTSRTTNASVTAGVRLFARPGLDGVAELVVFPGRLVHPTVHLAWVFDWFSKP